MLPSQRALFDMPREICYLNAAAFSPLPRAVQAAGERGAVRKSRPWEMEAWESASRTQCERARSAAARLIGADADDVAIVPSVGYGFATVGRNLTLAHGQRVLVLQDDHSSPVLEWLGRAPVQGFQVETVARPADADWTGAVLAGIARPGAPAPALVSISSVHWSDGGLLDMHRIAAASRAHGAALAIDATHHVGMLPTDVCQLDPDFLMFPTYKWVLGPYGRAFLYVAKRWQGGIPLEQTSSGRRAVEAAGVPYLRDTNYVDNARRFDVGERDFFIGLEMASVGMELLAEWGTSAIVERLSMLTGRLADGLRGAAVTIAPAHLRAPHVLSLGFPDGIPPDLPERLAAENVHVSRRLDRLRITPHVYNDEADIDRFLAAFRKLTS